MKVSLEKQIVIGYIINMLVVLAIGFIIWNHMYYKASKLWGWIALCLVVLSLGMLTIVYFVISAQLIAKKKSQMQLLENEKLLQSIIDNTSNAISVKKINGEYLFVNKQYELFFKLKASHIKGKTDHDFLSKEIADKYRDSDLEVVKLEEEIQIEETIQESDGLHTYLAVKFPLFDASNRVYAIGNISTDITERNASHQLLVAGNNFFNMSMDMLIISSNNTFLKVNPATLKILGYTEEELLGKPFLSFVYEEDIRRTSKELKKLQSGAISENFENRYVCKDGSLKWLSWNTYPDVKTGNLYAVARDVTVKKIYEESLKTGDTFFKMSLDILVVVSQGKFIKINPSLSNVLGYSESELLRNPFINFVYPEDVATTEKEIVHLKKGMSLVNFRNRWVCKDGTVKWLSWTATSDISTGILYARARDITELLKLEQEEQEALNELYENEQKLNLILENISDGVIVANADKEVILANYMANELFEIEDDSKISVNFSDHFKLFFPDGETTFPLQDLPMERAMAGEQTDDIDVLLLNPTSEEAKRVLLSGRPIFNTNNEVIAAVITIKDISRYKIMEKELKETELKYRNLIGFKKDKK